VKFTPRFQRDIEKIADHESADTTTIRETSYMCQRNLGKFIKINEEEDRMEKDEDVPKEVTPARKRIKPLH
jgi:hypothetical protein